MYPISHDQRDSSNAQFLASSHDESQLCEFRSSPIPPLVKTWGLSNVSLQVFLLVSLTASEASPLFLDEPNIENLVDDFWDYFFFFVMGLPLDPGAILLIIRLSVIHILSVDCEMSTWSDWSPCLETCVATRHQIWEKLLKFSEPKKFPHIHLESRF